MTTRARQPGPSAAARPGAPPDSPRQGPLLRLPDAVTLAQVHRLKYGADDQLGWGPQLRRQHGYHSPDDVYEALLALLVVPGLHWLDVGCGRELFPNNRPLARLLAARAGRLVGVDPDPTLQENPFVHEKVPRAIDAYDGQGAFDLVTLRMVAEHVVEPRRCVDAIARALAPGGLAVVYTVFGFAPMPLLTRLLPMSLRHPIKRFLWGTEAKDTFPTAFQMNTRGRLRELFAGASLQEAAFLRLDDCRTFARFRSLCELELRARGLCRRLGMPYPEHCLLGVYRKP